MRRSTSRRGWRTRSRREFARAEGAAFVGGIGRQPAQGVPDQSGQRRRAMRRGAFGTLQYLASGAAGDFAANPQERLIDLVQALRAPYRQGASFVMNAATLARIRKFKTSDGAFLWQPGLAAGQPATLLGYPVVEAEDMPDIAANSAVDRVRQFPAGLSDRGADARPRSCAIRIRNKPFVSFYATKRVGGCVVNSGGDQADEVRARADGRRRGASSARRGPPPPPRCAARSRSPCRGGSSRMTMMSGSAVPAAVVAEVVAAARAYLRLATACEDGAAGAAGGERRWRLAEAFCGAALVRARRSRTVLAAAAAGSGCGGAGDGDRGGDGDAAGGAPVGRRRYAVDIDADGIGWVRVAAARAWCGELYARGWRRTGRRCRRRWRRAWCCWRRICSSIATAARCRRRRWRRCGGRSGGCGWRSGRA